MGQQPRSSHSGPISTIPAAQNFEYDLRRFTDCALLDRYKEPRTVKTLGRQLSMPLKLTFEVSALALPCGSHPRHEKVSRFDKSLRAMMAFFLPPPGDDLIHIQDHVTCKIVIEGKRTWQSTGVQGNGKQCREGMVGFMLPLPT